MGPRPSIEPAAFDPQADPFACAERNAAAMDAGTRGDADTRLGPSRLWGLDVTSELHRAGVNLRHLGLLRSRFWRRVTGGARCDFGSNVLRTSVDFRLEIARGARLLVAGRVFHVSLNDDRPFTCSECPVEETFEGLSTNELTVFTGEVRDARNSKEIRVACLCEMVARAAKGLLRFAMRRSAKLHGAVVASISAPFAVDLFNALTGAHPRADVVWQEEIVPKVIQSYGTVACNPVEAATARTTLIPCLPYLIRRVASLTGVPVAGRALAALDAAPDGFEFVSADLTEFGDAAVAAPSGGTGARPAVRPVLKHGVPHLDAARGLLIAHRARHARDAGYAALVLRHRPPLYLPLDERPGAHLARNRGDLGGRLDGYFASGVYPGVPRDAASDAADDDTVRQTTEGPRCCRFAPEQSGHVVSAYAPRCSPQKPSEPFAIECWALLAEGGDGTARIALMTGRGALSVLTTNDWCFTMFCGTAEVSVRGPKAILGAWVHCSGCYDGTMMRLFVDAKVVARVHRAPRGKSYSSVLVLRRCTPRGRHSSQSNAAKFTRNGARTAETRVVGRRSSSRRRC